MKPIALISPLALAACSEPVPTAEDFIPDYLGAEAISLDEDIVLFRVAMTNAQSDTDVRNYAECAAVGYTVERGYGFARHLSTNVYNEAGVWSADAVYTISPNLPDGPVKIDAEIAAAACAERGIPTV
ncbi:MAG: hypothetical protein AAGF48_15935 [Pseudomonadota bacterium]